MGRSYVPKLLRKKVVEQARQRCGYCLTAEANVGYKMDIEHIIPISAGGLTTENNLWLSCAECNSYKSDKTHATDSFNGESIALYNPRLQAWTLHFEWSTDGAIIVGKTAIGRATVEALFLNREWLVLARQRWVIVGWHPPKD